MTTATAPIAAPAKARSARKSTKLQGLQVFMENKLAVFGVCLILILMAFSFIGPMFYVTDQIHTDLSNSALAPSSEHPLGTDMVGYDQLGRLMRVARPRSSSACSPVSSPPRSARCTARSPASWAAGSTRS